MRIKIKRITIIIIAVLVLCACSEKLTIEAVSIEDILSVYPEVSENDYFYCDNYDDIRMARFEAEASAKPNDDYLETLDSYFMPISLPEHISFSHIVIYPTEQELHFLDNNGEEYNNLISIRCIENYNGQELFNYWLQKDESYLVDLNNRLFACWEWDDYKSYCWYENRDTFLADLPDYMTDQEVENMLQIEKVKIDAYDSFKVFSLNALYDMDDDRQNLDSFSYEPCYYLLDNYPDGMEFDNICFSEISVVSCYKDFKSGAELKLTWWPLFDEHKNYDRLGSYAITKSKGITYYCSNVKYDEELTDVPYYIEIRWTQAGRCFEFSMTGTEPFDNNILDYCKLNKVKVK